MNGWEIVASFVFGLLVNEMTDVSPWAARKLVRWAAHRWTADPDLAAGYAEEWTAIIDERPGKLLKLLTAVQFSIGAVGRAAPRALASARDAGVRWILNVATVAEAHAHDIVRYAGFAVGLASVVLTGVVAIFAEVLETATRIMAIVASSFALLGSFLSERGRRRTRIRK